MSSFLARVITVAVTVSAIACGGAPPATTCEDAVQNGAETGVDCGGGCWAGCAIGGGCAADTDCMFAQCDQGTCLAPVDGPAPTGAVSATIDPVGTTIDFVSDERVAFHLEVPPGAVETPVAITISPSSPGNGSWFAARVDPGGVIFRVPATLTVTLPPGVDPGTGFLGAAADVGIGRYIGPTTNDSGARTLVSTLSFLGDPSSHPNPEVLARVAGQPLGDPDPNAAHWRIFIQQASRLPAQQIIPLLQQLADSVLREGRFEDAAALASVITALRERQFAGADQELIDVFLNQTRSDTCARLTEQLTMLDTARPKCRWELQTVIDPVFSSQGILLALGTDSGNACPNTQDWHDRVSTRVAYTIDSFEHRRGEWERCECVRPLRTGEQRAAACMHVPSVAFGPAPMVQTWQWQLMTTAVAADRQTFDSLHALGLGAYAPPLATAFTDAEVGIVRKLAYDSCLDDQDMSYLHALAKVVLDPARAAILTDAQHCASTLAITSVDGTGATRSTTTVSPGATPGSTSVDVNATAFLGNTIQVRGPLSTLVCRPTLTEPSQFEADVLTLFAQSGTVRNQLGTLQANGSATVMTTSLGFNVDVDATRAALGIAADAPFDLVLERSGPGCTLHMTAVVYRVHVSDRQDRLVQVTDPTLGRFQVYKVEPTGTTAVFDAAVPAAAGDLWVAGWYLRQQGVAVIMTNDPSDMYAGLYAGWGFLDAAGTVNVVRPVTFFTMDNAAAVSGNGRYRVHGVDGDTTTGGDFILEIYDNATNLVVDTVAPMKSIFAIGPAGEVLLKDFGNNPMYVRALGSGLVSIGSFSPSRARFGPLGDKVYLHESGIGITEVVVATGATRLLPSLTPSFEWTVESDAIIWADLANSQLVRYDLVTAQSTVVGSLPASGYLTVVP